MGKKDEGHRRAHHHRAQGGKNLLRFEHQTDGCAKGFSIHHFKLTPL
jgi:hypothetical protein